MISTHLGFGFEPSKSFKFLYADVAELADALASGASDRKVMWVQVPSSAPNLCNKIDAHLEKLVFTSFFCVLRVKISGVKPWMLFRKKRI